ncbi:glutamine amidotransferase-related protein [Agarivorans sp. Toyoura001]|uniref:glutamine amidotransferase-related protein n=1 Tax=unclassified Agarivorans TaxID=2636026 RepID=UPI0010DC9145|nr:gamma-glutamyl-gamma-aminobutyrate hydrolase family protein [Agarivorans sp. Toyoura001]GDY25209.1 glutamine amidotransferase [Agarivorans sp. Toyoura001]
MQIALLNCDRVDSQLVEEFGEYPDMFKQHLLAQDSKLQFDVFDVLNNELPKLNQFDGFLITGSRHNAYDQQPWILQLVSWVQQCEQLQRPLAGICFGHQIIARALGGKVEKSAKGWGLGVAANNLLQKPSWVSPSLEDEDTAKAEPFRILVSHQDQVTQLPPQAELLASSDFCPNFMYQIDQHILAIQGHPEFAPDYAAALIDKRQMILSPTQFVLAKTSLKRPLNADSVFDWIVQMYKLQ